MMVDATQSLTWLSQCLNNGFATRSQQFASAPTGTHSPPDHELAQAEPQPLNRTLVFLAETIAETMMIDPQLAAALASCEEDLFWQTLNNGAECQLNTEHSAPPIESQEYGLFLMPPNTTSHYVQAPKAQIWWVLAGSCVFVQRSETTSLNQDCLITTPPLSNFVIKTQTQPCLLAWCR